MSAYVHGFGDCYERVLHSQEDRQKMKLELSPRMFAKFLAAAQEVKKRTPSMGWNDALRQCGVPNYWRGVMHCLLDHGQPQHDDFLWAWVDWENY